MDEFEQIEILETMVDDGNPIDYGAMGYEVTTFDAPAGQANKFDISMKPPEM
jgi:hypothetical protein